MVVQFQSSKCTEIASFARTETLVCLNLSEKLCEYYSESECSPLFLMKECKHDWSYSTRIYIFSR